MKIIFDARYINMSGIGTYIKNIIAATIQKKEKKITFLFSNQNHASEEIKKLKELKISILFINSLPFSLKEQFEIHSLLKKQNPKIFHSPHFNIPFFINKKTKLICTIHDIALDVYKEEVKSIFHQMYYKLCMKKIKKTATVISVSNYTKSAIEDHYGIKNSYMIHNTFDYEKIQMVPIKRKEKTLLFVGINKKRKNLNFLIDVMALLPEDVKLTIIGSKNSNELNINKKINNLKLTKQITTLGFVDKKTLIEHYQTSTALIFPSLLEGFGYPIIEAAAYQLPVIASNQSALPEVGKNGCLYFNPKDKQDCKERILELINSPSLQKQLIKTNYEQLNRFNILDGLKKLLDIYNEVQ